MENSLFKAKFNLLLTGITLKYPSHYEGGEFFELAVDAFNEKYTFNFNFPKVLNVEDFIDLEQQINIYAQEHFSPEAHAIMNVHYYDKSLTKEELAGYYQYILNNLPSSALKLRYLTQLNSNFNDNEIVFFVGDDNDKNLFSDVIDKLSQLFSRYQINPKIRLEISQFEQTSSEIVNQALQKNNKDAELKIAQFQALPENKPSEKVNKHKPRLKAGLNIKRSDIKEIPQTQEELEEYREQHDGNTSFVIEGTFLKSEIQTMKNGSMLFSGVLYDGTDSIKLKTFLSLQNKEAEKAYYASYAEVGKSMRLYGTAQYDTFDNDIVFRIMDSTTVETRNFDDSRVDNAPVKRVELHCHTKMSTLDGCIDTEEYVKLAASWGWKKLAVTDHNSMQSLHVFENICAKKNMEHIFGVECSYIDEKAQQITWGPSCDKELKDAIFTVYDVETTGLHPMLDDIIQISAVRVQGGNIIDNFDSFVHTDKELSAFITNLTHIHQSDLEKAPSLKEAISAFNDYAKDSILVAHNARFDTSCLACSEERTGLPISDYPILDTLELARALHPDFKAYNLDVLTKKYNVVLDNHHRADADSEATALCFVKMLNELADKGITHFQQINSIINDVSREYYGKQTPYHLCLLSKTFAGQISLNKILTDASTTHFGSKEPMLYKSVLEQNRHDILVGSGCYNSDVIAALLGKRDEDVLRLMSFYDYIEVQTPDTYEHLFESSRDDKQAILDIEWMIRRLIKLAQEAGKPVVATGDCHVLHPQDVFYRQCVTSRPMVGGGIHPLAKVQKFPRQVLLTTQEMLDAFSFLGEEKAYEIVVTNSNEIANKCTNYDLFPKKLFNPQDDFLTKMGIPSCSEYLRNMTFGNAKKIYGDPLPQIIQDRLDKETKAIIGNGYATIYLVAHLLVKNSTDSGYIVGSRGSVGSSLTAYFMGITEVNALPPHYYCPECFFSVFKLDNKLKAQYPLNELQSNFDEEMQKYGTGFDMPDATCPCCGAKLKKSGVDIPFETFLGFKGDKTPDIDLNFSGEIQPQAQEFIRTMFGPERSFKAGTVQTLADKTSYGYVKGYSEEHGLHFRKCEIDRMASKVDGIKKTTGCHPGGVVVLPLEIQATDVIPLQYPSEDVNSDWLTTHYDYHSFESNLLKFDILGHDDPTMIRFLMNDVERHPENYPFNAVSDIPIADKATLSLFSSCEALGIAPASIGGETLGVLGIPEFGTETSRKALRDILPKDVDDLIRVAGLTHGTDVWENNAKELFFGTTKLGIDKIPFNQLIGCRDDILKNLSQWGVEPADAFKIMEKVRKGKGIEGEGREAPAGPMTKKMRDAHVPEWYIWSCNKIAYMYPKAHATAYVIMGLRIGWFKVHSPLVYYAGFFSRRCDAFDYESMIGGYDSINARINELEARSRNRSSGADKLTPKETASLKSLYLAREMTARGYGFKPLNLEKGDWHDFIIDGNDLIFPFNTVDSMGDNMAKSIIDARNERAFSSFEDFMERTAVTKTVGEKLKNFGVFGNLDTEEVIKLF